MNAKRFYPTAIALYFTYFIHGIGVSILGQYKQDFAGVWGADKLSDGTFDVSMVIAVIAALGLGRLLTLPISGPFSDKFGRKPSALIGVGLYAVYFIGLAFAPNMYIAYAFAFVGGAANSFLDTAVTPSVLEIFTKNGAIANMFTKFSISIGQFVLPFAIGMVAAANMSFRTLFVITMALIVIDGLIIAFMPFPPMNNNVGGEKAKPEKMKFNATSWAIIGIGFTCTSTFQLWLNCNQELGKLYGMADPSKIQSFSFIRNNVRNFNYRCSREEIYFASTYSNSLSSDCYINATDYLYRTNTYYLLNWWICYRVRCCRWSSTTSCIYGQ